MTIFSCASCPSVCLLWLSGCFAHLHFFIIIIELYGLFIIYFVGFHGGSDSEESTCNEGDPGSVPGLGKIPWRREWLPTLVFLPGGFHGQKSLACYSPWGYERVRHEALIKSWLVVSFTNIFSQSICYLFILFMVSFAIQNLVHLIRFICLFYFISIVLGPNLRKHWYDLCQKSLV